MVAGDFRQGAVGDGGGLEVAWGGAVTRDVLRFGGVTIKEGSEGEKEELLVILWILEGCFWCLHVDEFLQVCS